MNDLATLSPFLGLPLVIRTLRGAVGGWGGRGFLSAALAFLLYRRLGEICGTIERMAARFQAGRLWRVESRTGARAGGGRRAGGKRLWPGRFGWLVRAAGYQAAGFGCQLRVVLARPEMVDLLKAAPQAARVLRPLCRMLAVETSLLRPGVEVAAPMSVSVADAAVATVRVRKPRVKVDWGRIPLPRGVLAWAKREGFGKVPRG